jgi:hypothetical protein
MLIAFLLIPDSWLLAPGFLFGDFGMAYQVKRPEGRAQRVAPPSPEWFELHGNFG